MWRDKIQISRKCGKPVSKTRQDEHRQCGARSGVINTQIFVSLPVSLRFICLYACISVCLLLPVCLIAFLLICLSACCVFICMLAYLIARCFLYV